MSPILRCAFPPPPEDITGTHFCYRLSPTQGHSAAGRIMSMKNSNHIGNRTRVLSACSAAPQPNAPPRAPKERHLFENLSICWRIILKWIVTVLEVYSSATG